MAGGMVLTEHRLERRRRLPAAVPWRCAAVDLNGGILIVLQNEFGTGGRSLRRQCAQGNHRAGGIPHIKLAEILRAGALLGVGLHIHLPLPAEIVEVIHQRSAHEALQGLIDIRQVDSLSQHLGLIDGDADLRDIVETGGIDTREFRPLARGLEESLAVGHQEIRAGAGAIFQQEGEAPRAAHAWNGGRSKDEGNPGRYRGQ